MYPAGSIVYPVGIPIAVHHPGMYLSYKKSCLHYSHAVACHILGFSFQGNILVVAQVYSIDIGGIVYITKLIVAALARSWSYIILKPKQ